MPFFYAWETIDFTIQLTREDGTTGVLQDARNIIISFGQGNALIEKDMTSGDVGFDVDNDTINVRLSQEETGKFTPNHKAICQINILYESSERDTSCQVYIDVKPNLHRKVMA